MKVEAFKWTILDKFGIEIKDLSDFGLDKLHL